MDKREEVAHKLARVRRWLSEQHQPALLVRQRSNFAWITAGGRSHVNTARDAGAAALLITANRFVLLASNIEAERLVDEELADVPVDVAPYPWHDDDGERRLIAGIVGRGAAPVVDTESGVAAAVAGLRATLLGPEIRRLEQLGEITSRIVEQLCRRIEPGETEHEVAAQLHAAAVAHGARVPVCLIAADDRIARRRHPLPTAQTVDTRAMVAVCIERAGLICSATRLVSFARLGDDLRRRHEAVCRVHAAAATATRVGRPLRGIFAEIVAAYDRAGFPDEWREHHQGGSTGYQPRDVVAGPGSSAVVQSDQPFAWNPSIAGTKSEDTMLVTAAGIRWITAPGEGWPTLAVEIGGEAIRRPDILQRDP